jgi:hypothetical protein
VGVDTHRPDHYNSGFRLRQEPGFAFSSFAISLFREFLALFANISIFRQRVGTNHQNRVLINCGDGSSD